MGLNFKHKDLIQPNQYGSSHLPEACADHTTTANDHEYTSTSTKYCLPSNKKILTGVTARVDSKQIGLL